MLVETALGEVQKLKMKTAKCGENAGFGAKVRSGAAEVYGNLKMCDCACAIQIDRSLRSGVCLEVIFQIVTIQNIHDDQIKDCTRSKW